MDQEILATFRKRIENQINIIRDRLAQHTQGAVCIDLNELADEVDRASIEEFRRMALNRIEHDENKLKMLISALSRINNGEFGYCESCGEQINKHRLEIRPESAYCIDCQNIDETRAH